MTDASVSEELVSELQSRLAFQEDSIQQLSEQVAVQASELLTLRLQMQALNKKMQDALQQVESMAGIASTEPPPPHY